MSEVPIIKKNQSIDFSANQWTGFYMIGTAVKKELNFAADEFFGDILSFDKKLTKAVARKQNIHCTESQVFH